MDIKSSPLAQMHVNTDRSKNFVGGKTMYQPPSAFTTNEHNERYAFYKGKDSFLRKNLSR